MDSFISGVFFGLGIFLIIIILLIFILGLIWYYHYPISEFSNKFVEITLDKNTNSIISKVIPISEFFNSITNYFNNFITILVTIIGLGGILGYFKISRLTIKETQQYTETAMAEYFDSYEGERKNKYFNSEFYDNNADDIIKRIDLIDEKMDAINQELGLGQDLDLRNQ